MRRIILLTIAVMSLLSGTALVVSSHAPTKPTLTLQPGDNQPVVCADGRRPMTHTHNQRRDVFCPTAVATATATATMEPTATPTNTPEPTATATHDHGSTSMTHWHVPGAHDGLPAHEHGDAPPQWIIDAGYDAQFTHAANTVGENNVDHPAIKHTGFKGFAARFNGVDVYVIAHLDTTPSGHMSRYHSYQYWMRDPSGGVSHMHGWMDFGGGSNEGPNLRVNGCDDTGIRPIMAVNDEGCPFEFESWYSRAGGFKPDFGFNIRPQYFTGGDPNDPSTWNATGSSNLVRRIELAWYDFRTTLRGEFWATQFAEVVSGPNDARCGTTLTQGAKTYTRVCLKQYIAPTAQGVEFPGNSIQKTYPGPSPFQLPN